MSDAAKRHTPDLELKMHRKRTVVGYYDALEHAKRQSSRATSDPTLPTLPS